MHAKTFRKEAFEHWKRCESRYLIMNAWHFASTFGTMDARRAAREMLRMTLNVITKSIWRQETRWFNFFFRNIKIKNKIKTLMFRLSRFQLVANPLIERCDSRVNCWPIFYAASTSEWDDAFDNPHISRYFHQRIARVSITGVFRVNATSTQLRITHSNTDRAISLDALRLVEQWQFHTLFRGTCTRCDKKQRKNNLNFNLFDFFSLSFSST